MKKQAIPAPKKTLAALLSPETKMRETGIRLEPLTKEMHNILEMAIKEPSEAPGRLRAIAAQMLKSADEIETIAC